MLDKARLDLLLRLLQVAGIDSSRAFTSTWSSARLRTLLMRACLDEGHQVLEPGVPGTPSRAGHATRGARPADLQARPRSGARPLALDLLSGGHAPHGASEGLARPLSLATVHGAIDRVSSGAIDALLISADALAYDQLFGAVDGRSASRLQNLVAAVLPRAANFSRDKAHTCIVGDTTMATVGREVRAFGMSRVACAVYVVSY